MKTVQSINVFLRKLRGTDLDSYYMLVGDDDVMAYITGSSYSYQEAENELNRLVESYGQKSLFGVWAAESSSGEFLGTGFLLREGEHTANIGYRVLKKYWGRGYGTQIAKLLIEKAKHSGIEKLIAEVEMENEASLTILEKMKFELSEIKQNEHGNEVGLFILNI